jgi:subtilisin family serine protease
MKQFTFWTLCILLAGTALFYSCQNEGLDLNPGAVEKAIEQADLISYSSSEVIPDQYIVVFKNDAFPTLSGRSISSENYAESKAELTEKAKTLFSDNRILDKEFKQSYVKTIKGVAVELSTSEVEKLRLDERIKYIEQDQIVTVAMGGPPSGGNGGNDPQTTPWGITRVNGGASGAGKIAYIIDSGIDASHPDLNVNVSKGFNAFSNGPDADLTFDGSGHGTHVAGTIGALDNEIGVIGVAAGATVVPVKVLDRRGSGSYGGVIAGVDFVGAASDCDAANMSLGGGLSQALNEAVEAASSNCPFALAAGNESTDANTKSPASAQGSNVYTIASMTSSNGWSSFSNYGVDDNPVDYIAPGSSVFSTYKGDGYATLSGTSMASPHVCGILLLRATPANGGSVTGPDGEYTVASN